MLVRVRYLKAARLHRSSPRRSLASQLAAPLVLAYLLASPFVAPLRSPVLARMASSRSRDAAPTDSTSEELAPDSMEMAKEVVVEEDSGDVERTLESFVPDSQIVHLHGRNSAMQKSPIAMQNEAKLWAPGIELGSPASHLDTLTG